MRESAKIKRQDNSDIKKKEVMWPRIGNHWKMRKGFPGKLADGSTQKI